MIGWSRREKCERLNAAIYIRRLARIAGKVIHEIRTSLKVHIRLDTWKLSKF